MSPLDEGTAKESTTTTTTTTPVVPTGRPRFSHSHELMIRDSPNGMDEDHEVEISQEELVPTQSQFEFTQQTQDPDECSNLLPPLSLSPPPSVPWGRLVPAIPAAQAAVDLEPENDEYWIGRSSTRSDVAIRAGVGLCKKEKMAMAWAHSMISNRHCRIFKVTNGDNSSDIIVENYSGNGTWINQTIWLRKGEQRIIHSGDEICLANPMTLRKKVSSERVLQAVMQQYSYIFIQSGNRKAVVNPREMNYGNRRSSDTSSSAVSGGACSPRSGRRIEAHYELREVLGDGTSGQVRRGIHRQTGKEYAVKIISLRRHMDIKSMEDEVNMLRSLDHPYIVQLVDVFMQPGIAMYLVMELVSGGDLFERIVEQQRYTEVDARRLMRRVLSAVFYLHEHCNIVHRDLKPENILCSSPTDVKLADFGLAKMMEADGLKTFCGTPQYFAPEVLQRRHTATGQGRYGKPADMWSLGVILYILLTGHPPFGADIENPQQFSIEFEESLWQGMPQAQELVQLMLRTDPKRRLSIRQACDHPWINADDGDTHIHPLDDPNVTARKRLFATDSDSTGEKRPVEDTASESASLDDGNNSVVSKESMLSKEEFAHAAIASHCRADSGFRIIPEKLEESNPQKDSQVGNDSDQASTADEDSRPMEISPSKKRSDSMTSSTKEEAPRNAHHEGQDDSPVPSTTSPESAPIASHSQTSVTPECEVSPARSPLETLNLNKRTKQFRERVLLQSEESEDRPTSPGPEGTGRGDSTAAQDAAVTPNRSNVRNTSKEGVEASSMSEDPILSQFSSGPSSLESFPDTPPASKKTVTMKKRPLDDAAESGDNSDNKRRNKQKRQTTLSSWFVTKKT